MVASSPILAPNATRGMALPSHNLEERWYAAYTSANHEKRVAVQLGEKSLEHFLPLYDSVRCWKDRKVRLQLPLFPGYVFVHIALRDRLKVLQVPGVSKLVGFNGTPTALSDEEITALRTSLGLGVRAEPHPYLAPGRRLRIKAGPFAGLEGVLLRRRGRLQVVVSVDLLQRSVAIDLDLADVKLLE